MVLVILDNGYLVGTDGAGACEGSFVVRCLLFLRVFLSCRRSCLFNVQEFEFVSSVRSSYSHPDLLLIQHPLFQITPVLNTGLSLSEPLQLYKGYNAI